MLSLYNKLCCLYIIVVPYVGPYQHPKIGKMPLRGLFIPSTMESGPGRQMMQEMHRATLWNFRPSMESAIALIRELN